MLAWTAIAVGAVFALIGLTGVAGLAAPGLGARVEPRLDGAGHLLLAACLIIVGSRDATGSDSTGLGLAGSLLGLVGLVVLVGTHRRAGAAVARRSRTLYGRAEPARVED